MVLTRTMRDDLSEELPTWYDSKISIIGDLAVPSKSLEVRSLRLILTLNDHFLACWVQRRQNRRRQRLEACRSP